MNFHVPLYAFLLCVSLLACTRGLAQSTPTLDDADRAYLDSLLTDKFPPDGPGGTMLVAKDGVPIYEKSFGLASMELRVPNHPGNVYKIGSISKQFTAVAALQLVEAGQLDLNADIRKYLPDFGGDTPITVARLMDHSSGIPSNGQLPEQPAWDNLTVNADSIVSYLGQQPLLFAPGEEWSYTNNAFALLGIIVERVSGQSLSDYWQEHIFGPLGMRSTYTSDKRSVSPDRATGYTSNAAGGYDYVVETPFASYFIGAGFISSTVGDMLRWHEGLMAGEVVSKNLLKRAWTPGKLNDGRTNEYNSGWGLNEFQGLQLVHHGGAIGGARAYEMAVPERGIYAVCLTNTDDFRPTSFVEEAVRRALDLELPTYEPVDLSREELEAYTGVYPVYSQSLRKVNYPGSLPVMRYVRVRNDSLFYQIDEEELVPLLSAGKDRFVTEEGDGALLFERDAAGKVTALSLPISGMIAYGLVPREEKSDRPLPPVAVAVDLPRAQLEAMVGTYALEAAPEQHIEIDLEEGQLRAGGPNVGIPMGVYQTISKELIKPGGKSDLGPVIVKWQEDKVIAVALKLGGNEYVAKRIK